MIVVIGIIIVINLIIAVIILKINEFLHRSPPYVCII